MSHWSIPGLSADEKVPLPGGGEKVMVVQPRNGSSAKNHYLCKNHARVCLKNRHSLASLQKNITSSILHFPFFGQLANE